MSKLPDIVDVRTKKNGSYLGFLETPIEEFPAEYNALKIRMQLSTI
jgi:hypothetical protein